MRYDEMMHVLRAAKRVWSDAGLPEDSTIGVVGSQSILFFSGRRSLPDDIVMSREADIFLVEHPNVETSDIVIRRTLQGRVS